MKERMNFIFTLDSIVQFSITHFGCLLFPLPYLSISIQNTIHFNHLTVCLAPLDLVMELYLIKMLPPHCINAYMCFSFYCVFITLFVS